MAKRGRKKKFKVSFSISPETSRSILAVFLLLFSVIALISFIAPGYFLNEKIQIAFRKSFGFSSFVIPVITAATGLIFIDSLKNKVKELRVIIGLVILLFTLSGLFHIFIDPETSKQMALDGAGGGYVGYILSFGLSSLISIYGGVAALLAFFVVSVIFIFDISLNTIAEFAREKLKLPGIFKKKDKVEKKEKLKGEESETAIKTEIQGSEAIEINEVEKIDKEEKFEIIPSMSEPQTGVDLEALQKTQIDIEGVSTGSPSLPYADKVWELPPLDLLSSAPEIPPDTGDVEDSARIIIETLKSFGIPVTIKDTQVGPTVTKFALEAPPGVKVAKISNLQTNIALALASPTGSVRIEAPIPGKSLIGIEVPNKKRGMVSFKPLISSDRMRNIKSKLEIVLGKDVGGIAHTYNIGAMPHLLIAGSTGSGKSIFIHNLIFSILFRATPQEVKFIMIDPKRVELQAYADIPHLFTPLVTDIEKAPAVFKWSVTEMTRRLKLFQSAKVRNIQTYNEKSGFQALPYIVIIVDELAEIMVADPAAVEKSIIRIAQLARATGIHLVLAAQRPSANIITGLIKANIPCRIAFSVTGQVDSRVIIDQTGAEKLLGKGDMLFVPPDKPTPTRLQGAFIGDNEIRDLVNFLKGQGVPPDYNEEILDMPADDVKGRKKSVSAGGDSVDALYDEALETVVSSGKASASLLQRRLSIGYARAARIIDELEENGIVGPAQGSRAREILAVPESLEDIVEPDEITAPEIEE